MYLCVTALVATATLVAGHASAAWACAPSPNSAHCYLVGEAAGGDNGGQYAQLSPNCLYMPNNGNFVTQEMWDATSKTGANWTEVGLISGSFNGNYYNHQWFWADQRPNGGGFHFHATGGTGGNATYSVEMTYAGNNTWYIYGGNSFTQIGTSTNQPETTDGTGRSDFGTEYTANAGAGMRDVGTIYNMEWESTSGAWYSEGTAAHAALIGPGPYIVGGAYYPANSYLQMQGPC